LFYRCVKFNPKIIFKRFFIAEGGENRAIVRLKIGMIKVSAETSIAGHRTNQATPQRYLLQRVADGGNDGIMKRKIVNEHTITLYHKNRISQKENHIRKILV